MLTGIEIDIFHMFTRVAIIAVYSLSVAISLYAMVVTRKNYHLIGVVVWCCNVLAFTLVALLRAVGIVNISATVLNIWSSVVRLHGGLVMLSMSVYYMVRSSL